MRRLGTLLAVLVLLVAGTYGFYWYKVKSGMDELVEKAAPFADIRYQSIYAHPDGTIGVDQLEVLPSGEYEPFTATSVRVRPDNPLYWITGGDEPPKSLNIQVRQLEQGMDTGLMKSMQEQFDLQREADPLHVSPSALGCGDVRQLDINTMKSMGYRSLVTDIDMQYSGDQQARKLNFSILADVEGLAELQFEMRMSADPDQLRNPMQATGTARLEKFELNYTDKGYNKRLAAYCARQADSKPGEYRSEHQRLYNAWLDNNGINIPESWRQAYADLQQEGARLTLALNPIGGFGAGEMMMAQDPVYLIEKANPNVLVNGKPLPLDNVDWMALFTSVAQAGSGTAVARTDESDTAETATETEMASQAETAAESVGSDAPANASAADSQAEAAAAPAPKGYKQTDKAQLGNYLGARVRIFTYFGRDVAGTLVAVDDKGIRVSQRMAQGVAEYPLEYERIQQVEVYR
ncbi:hypothetical protein H9C73_05665 [Marinobacterium sp. AK62]|uniref:DUF4340 domain-containing protein n=1 Tax=Marinobacterium alkalitolerans TaxID=1542925 RepID=A0ABS3Z927_9GAMM|nr:hypothetical protein [Marinobacterium alkalitolerans]MBP0048216.1 hypothetical protein [Marinobacterium alkalitolerans]